jgi:hypothetical protein
MHLQSARKEILMSTSPAIYPLQLEAELEPRLSRWLWLVKWFLVIPHVIVLFFLWIGLAVTTVVALFAILFSGRYPRALFNYNAGVLRWSWRVGFYTCSALGTDRYPPFTLGEVADYPAHLTIEYPESLSRGLVLIKWWLHALPHYLVVGVFGGLAWAAASDTTVEGLGGGLIGLLVLFAGIMLLFTGRYPQSIYDFVLGMNRWVFRVAAYSLLLTDVYPPFRLDLGSSEPPAGATTIAPTHIPAPAA